MYEYQSSLIRVVDADTVELSVSLGFGVTKSEVFRLGGVNAPERFTAAGKLATQFVQAWFMTQSKLTIQSAKPLKQEKFGRYLARITGDNSVLNDELLRAGHAEPYMSELGS